MNEIMNEIETNKANEVTEKEHREEKLMEYLKTNKLFSAFIVISIISIILAILKVYTPMIWITLCILSLISAALVFFKKDNFSFYPLVIWVIFLAFKIRTLNLSGLRDITTGGWTLGPDLDPFLFLRWAKYIIEHGSLIARDAMRYFPLGYDTSRELLGTPYSIVIFHKIASLFGSYSIEQSAALMPAFVFIIGLIPFFFLVRKLFYSLGNTNSSIISIIASILVAVIPVFIPRTVAGIPEKEAVGIPLMFFAFCFFIYAWDAKKTWTRIILSLLAGISTALMSLTWGGFIYIYAAIGIATLTAFVLGKIDVQKAYIYSIWIVSSILLVVNLTNRYTIAGLASSPTTGLSMIVLGIILVDMIMNKTRLKNYSEKIKIPKPIISIIITLVIGLLISILLFGFSFPLGVFNDIKGNLVSPTVDRIGVTVAENKQPFFSEWADSFGPTIKGMPLSFWLFFFGSIFLFWQMTSFFSKRDRMLSTASYSVFLICIIFSRYSSASLMNGTNGLSILVYLLGFLSLIGTLGYIYLSYYKKGELEKFKEIDFNLIWIFAFFFLSIISARGAVRLTMMLVPPAAIIIAYFAVSSISSAMKVKDNTMKVVTWIVVAIILISTILSCYQFYLGAINTTKGYVPSIYTQQWQKAMSWVRDNTLSSAVFGHWWDYGYWVQTIGERATVLDGGNSISYWDYLMGRYALTGTDDREALDFLYAHNTTHFLIDSSDIGKYPAFSSIGSDEKYDRYSWFDTLIKDTGQTVEYKNSTSFVYTGGFPLDNDIIYDDNGIKIFIPMSSKSGLIGIITERDNTGKIIKNPIAVFIYQNKQYKIPLRYAFDSTSKEFIDFKSGLDAGIFIFPYISQNGNNVGIDKDGAIMYMSSRIIYSRVARLYLFRENNNYFKLVHSEDDFVVDELKSKNAINSDFIYYQGFRGPIRIWELNYPTEMKINTEYLEKRYPNERLTA